ncbi:DUF6125 family protein [Chloroflexota bacterium]
MTELLDYSGPFDPDFSHDILSKEILVQLLTAYNEYTKRIDGFWYLTVMDKWGNDEAFDCDAKVWEKVRPYEVDRISSLMGIKGDDISTVMKYLQVCPGMQLFDTHIDVKTPHHAIVTFSNCSTLAALEERGKGKREVNMPGTGTQDAHQNSPVFQPEYKGYRSQAATPNRL